MVLKPWSCTPTWVRWAGITRRMPVRPSSSRPASPVASKVSSAAPYWNPWVHSVQPRVVYFPPTVNTGAP